LTRVTRRIDYKRGRRRKKQQNSGKGKITQKEGKQGGGKKNRNPVKGDEKIRSHKGIIL